MFCCEFIIGCVEVLFCLLSVVGVVVVARGVLLMVMGLIVGLWFSCGS